MLTTSGLTAIVDALCVVSAATEPSIITAVMKEIVVIMVNKANIIGEEDRLAMDIVFVVDDGDDDDDEDNNTFNIVSSFENNNNDTFVPAC